MGTQGQPAGRGALDELYPPYPSPSQAMHFQLATTVLFTLSAVVAQSTTGRLIADAYGTGRTRGGGFGADVATFADADGDGTRDVIVADWSEDELVLLSGVDLSRIRTIATPALYCDAVDDVDGDGTPDIACASRFNLSVFSSASGAVVFSMGVLNESLDVAGVGDWNGDGTPDVARRRQGGVDIHSGSDGATLQTVGTIFSQSIAAIGGPTATGLALCDRGVSLFLAGGATAWTSQAVDYVSVDAGGDVDGDGFEEVLAMARTGRVDVLSGASGGVLSTITTAGGTSISGGVDLDGDAVADVAVGDRTSGFVRAYSGSSGALLIERCGHKTDAFAWSTALHPGVGTAGRAAILVGAPSRFGTTVTTGAVLAFAQAAPGEVEGSIESFGFSCNFSQLYPNPGLPRIGSRLGLRFDSNNGTGFQYVLIGASKTSFNGVPLPVVPTSSSCALRVSIDIVQSAGFNANTSIFIPNNPVFVGTVVHVQGASLTADPFFPRFETSNGLSLSIGN